MAVKPQTMPLGNLTHMTDDERRKLGRWIQDGAPIEDPKAPPASMPTPGTTPTPAPGSAPP